MRTDFIYTAMVFFLISAHQQHRTGKITLLTTLHWVQVRSQLQSYHDSQQREEPISPKATEVLPSFTASLPNTSYLRAWYLYCMYIRTTQCHVVIVTCRWSKEIKWRHYNCIRIHVIPAWPTTYAQHTLLYCCTVKMADAEQQQPVEQGTSGAAMLSIERSEFDRLQVRTSRSSTTSL